MATDPATIERILALADPARPLVAKKMFGEYGLYLDDRMIAMVCDDRLFVKPTNAGRALLEAGGAAIVEAPPYPGAKAHFLVAADEGARAGMQRLFDTTAAALPVPKPKARKTAG